MDTLNLCLWIVGLALQLLLVALLFARREAGRVLLFTLLLMFYIARSALLFALPGHVSRAAYNRLYDVLSFADLGLQIILASRIAVHIVRQTYGWTMRSSPKIAGILCGGLVLAVGVSAALPHSGPAPVDRGAALTAVSMALLVLWARLAGVAGEWLRIAEGFAIYGIANSVAGVVRANAALHRSQSVYAAGAYGQAAVYLCVVVFWILVLKPDQAALPYAGLREAQPN